VSQKKQKYKRVTQLKNKLYCLCGFQSEKSTFFKKRRKQEELDEENKGLADFILVVPGSMTKTY
jgi:hypothetical protein